VQDELTWARAAWAGYAGVDGGFWPGRVRLEVSPSSRICPPGSAGLVVLGDAAIVTVPQQRYAAVLRDVLPGVPLGRLTDPAAVAPGIAAAGLLGPAELAFAGPSRLRPVGGAPGPGPGRSGRIGRRRRRAVGRAARAVAGAGAGVDRGGRPAGFRDLRQPAEHPARRPGGPGHALICP
jgi:hypothetical protein